MKFSAPRRIAGTLILLAGVGLALSLLFDGYRPIRPKNVILITLDTTRPDALGAYGNLNAGTPNLDALAAQGNVFTRAYSHAPITLPSHSSILTGLTPPQHGVRNNITYRLREDHTTLAERLKAEGFATAAFVSSIILDSRFGLAQGFDVYEDNIVHYTKKSPKAIVTRRAGTTVDAALEWLDSQQADHPDEPFFEWIHFYDAHAPYDPPLPYKHAYADAPYQGEIAYMDQQIGRLLDALRRHKIAEETLIIVTADHGESFGEHGEHTHGFFCYGATTDVPLIVSMPVFGDRGARLTHPVQSIDLVPSIFGVLGFDIPTELDGTLLSSTADRAVIGEAIIPKEDFYLSPVHSIKDGRYAFYYSSDLELYDLQSDPDEKHNLASSQPDVAARYLDRVQAALDMAESNSERVSVDQATIEMLRSLGYVADGGTAPELAGDPFLRPSPLASVGVYRTLQNLRQFEDVYPFKMIEGLLELVEAHPRQIILHRELGRLLVLAGKETEGIAHLRQATDLLPTDPRLHTFLGLGHHQFGHFDDAIAEYNLALELNPEHSIARYNLALAQLAKGEQDLARQNLETVVEQNPTDALALNNLAYIAFNIEQDPDKARSLIERAAKANPDHPLIKQNLRRYAAESASEPTDDDGE
ncbi:MAG: sulfatase-like hydrolase/transferase [Lysobacteraceae bacterium]